MPSGPVVGNVLEQGSAAGGSEAMDYRWSTFVQSSEEEGSEEPMEEVEEEPTDNNPSGQ